MLAVLLPVASLQASQHKYDYLIEREFSKQLPEYEWQWFKAQLYQESRFKPLAVSPVGAQGLGQIMPGTWRDIAGGLRLPAHATAFDPKFNVKASAYYMRKQVNIWTSPRPPLDRLFLGMASYNAGAGNIIKAQRHCGMPSLYRDIIECLPEITGHHSKETIGYVENIYKFYYSFRFGL